jgi:hypothetical protein
MMTRRMGSCICVLLWTGCASSTPAPVTPEGGPLNDELVDANGAPAPAWVTAPTSYRKDVDDMRVVCGEGAIGGTRNMSMAQTAAAARARTELARTLETKVTAMVKDYQATTTGGEQFGTAANDEQHVQDASKQITQATLSGTEVNETWISKRSTLHALVCLNVERFKGIVSGMSQLNEQIRAAVVERAEKAWDELDAIGSQHPAAAPHGDRSVSVRGHATGRDGETEQ